MEFSTFQTNMRAKYLVNATTSVPASREMPNESADERRNLLLHFPQLHAALNLTAEERASDELWLTKIPPEYQEKVRAEVAQRQAKTQLV